MIDELFTGYLLWFIIGTVLIAFELVIPGVYFVWFGLAALVVGGITWLYPIGVILQIAIFAFLALIFAFIGVKVYRKGKGTIDSGHLNTVRGSEYIGKIFITPSDISNGTGRLSIGDSNWTIIGENCKVGTKIQITGVELNSLTFIIIEDEASPYPAEEEE